MLTPTKPTVAGVIVLFHPDESILANLRAARRQVAALYIVDNTPRGVPNRTQGWSEFGTVIHSGINLGLGAAYNLGCEQALRRGYTWVLLLDQDTLLNGDYLQVMSAHLDGHGRASNATIGIAGPGFSHRSRPEMQTVQRRPISEVPAVVSSGSLVLIDCWRVSGRFREDFFIDYIDTEFCLRARAHRYSVIAIGEVLMVHGIGASAPNRVLGYERVTSNYPAFRHYYMSRNFILTARSSVAPSGWLVPELIKRAKFMLLSLAMERGRRAVLTATVRGVFDGWRAPRHAPRVGYRDTEERSA